MTQLVALIYAHPTYSALVGYFLFMSAVSAMDPPAGPGFYSWLYKFLHSVSANWDKVVKRP